MLLPKRQFYQLPDIKDSTDIFTSIKRLFTIEEEEEQTVTEQFFDSFDWRLLKNNLFLVQSNNRFRLTDLDEHINYEADGGNGQKHFWWDFTTQPLRDLLEPVLNYRAVCSLVHVRKVKTDYRMTNKDVKTVLNISTVVYLPVDDDVDNEIAAYLELKGVRGYDSVFKKADKIIRHHGAKKSKAGPSILSSVLQTSSRKPLDYSSKYSISLEVDWGVGRVSSIICLRLLDTMNRNVDFILSDIDTEFLHDFRVAVRRTRSYLSLMKTLLPEKIAYFMEEFKWLGSLTGPVRDLDVYLLKKNHYTSMLPKKLGDGLPFFLNDLKQQRQEAFEKMAVGLTSDRYRELIDDWHGYLSEMPNVTDNGDVKAHCLPEAVKRIHKRFKRIMKDGGKIDDASEDKLLHDLRLQAKKFRYLVEFFASFFQKSDVDRFVKHLKRLQDNLGDFNDLSVQQTMLEMYQAGLTGRNSQDLKTAAAIGGLISHLSLEQHGVRKKFKRTFKQFTQKETIRLFQKTFRE